MKIFRMTMEPLADKRRELEDAIGSMIPRIRQREGCKELCWFQDLEHNGIILFLVWQNRESLKDYLQSDQFSAILGTKILLKKPQSIQIYSVSGQEGIEAVQRIRSEKKAEKPHETL